MFYIDVILGLYTRSPREVTGKRKKKEKKKEEERVCITSGPITKGKKSKKKGDEKLVKNLKICGNNH